MERFRLCLLGPFQALLAGKPITGFESNKTRALLAYLAVENSRPHPREFLAELLWPERPQGVALANLRHTLADLRAAIADHDAAQPCLLVTHQTLQFDPACLASGDVFVDVVRFGAPLAGAACTSLAASEEAIAACEKAQDYVTRDMLVIQLDDTEMDHAYYLEKQIGLIELVGLANYQQSQMKAGA